MNWNKAAVRDKIARPADNKRIPIKPDADFWRSWRDDPAAMKAAGYRMRKIGNRWHVWIEQ